MAIEIRWRRWCNEREPADALRDKFNVIGGWLPSLTFALGEMKDELTAFQLEVEKGINDLLDHLGKHVVDRRIAGIGETYITGSVSNQDIIFWIYPDSAALQVGRRHRAFGFPKRESLLDTAGEFLDEFMKVVDGPDAAARN